MQSLLSLGARSVTLIVALLCGVLTARLILGDAGVEAYALYSLIASLPGLISFFDLGSGAAVVNAIARSDAPHTDPDVLARTTTVVRIMLVFAACVMAADALLYVTGGWAVILGDAGHLPGASVAAFACVAVFALGLPLNIWQRVLLGFGRNHIIILVQGLQAPLGLGIVFLLLRSHDSTITSFLAAAAFGAAFIVGVVGFLCAERLSLPLLRRTASRAFRPRLFPGVRVMDVGLPMLAQLVATPLSMTLQRYVLAQFLTAGALAEYGAAGQVFFALQGLVAAAGLALWPMFTRMRHEGRSTKGPFGLALLFASLVAVASLFVLVISPWLFAFISNDSLIVHPLTVVWFGAMVTAQAALFPLGMFIMDTRGIRFQVVPVFLMAITSVGGGIALTPMIGVIGPLVATTVAIIACQVIPFSVYILHNRQRLWGGTGQGRDAALESELNGPAV